MPDLELDPDEYRQAGTEPPPKLNAWQKLNAKPPGWDSPGAWVGRMIVAVIMGLGLLWVRSRH